MTGFGSSDDAPAIAEGIRKAFETLGKPVAEWSEIVRMLPELKFVPPVTFEAAGTALKEMGFVLAPQPPDEPRFMGPSV